MKFVLLSPHFPAQHFRYARALQEQGATVIGLADEPQGWLSSELKQNLTAYYQVADLNRYNEVYRTLGRIIWEHGRIDRLDSLNEHWLNLEAQLRSDFNIPGIQLDGIDRVKKKSEMKKIFQSLGIPCARGQRIEQDTSIYEVATDLGYPLVLKPDIGVGAGQTFFVESEARLRELIAAYPQQEWILEEYVQGQICTYDGLTNRQGQPVFATSMIYSQGIMEVVNSDNHVHYYTLREIPKDIEELGLKLLEAYKLESRFFHFEFFRCQDGSLKALEVNMRPPGGPSVDMFNYAHDIDLYREWANIMLHNHFNAKIERPYFCCYAGRKRNKHYLHRHEDILKRGQGLLVSMGEHPAIFRRAMGDVYYIFRTPDEAEMLALAEYIQAEHV